MNSKISHIIIKNLFDVLRYYNSSKAGKAGTVLNYYKAWKQLHSLAINISNEGWESINNLANKILGHGLGNGEERWMFLFAVETYLHLFIRALALSKLGALQSNVQSFKNDIQNKKSIFAPSIFEWVFEAIDDPSLRQNLVNNLRQSLDLMLNVLYNLNVKTLTTDVFRELYQNILPPEVRKSLGEFYTKEDIIDEVLDAAGLNKEALDNLYNRWRNGDKPVILDPACGSGSFLIRIVQRAFNALGCRTDVAKFLEDVLVGIDVNPFAVELARLNLILAIADGMHNKCNSLYLPGNIRVLWADSLSVYKSDFRTILTKKENGMDLTGQIKINIPALAEIIGKADIIVPSVPQLRVDELLDKVYSYVKEGRELRELLEESADLSTREKELKELYELMSKIHETGNSRIIELIKNSLVIADLIGKCDFVVGNPPWVRIHRIAGHLVQSLKNNYRYFAKDAPYNPQFKATKTPFKEQFDYSIAFVERGLGFLREEGVLAYVITSKIVKTSYAGALREDLVKNYMLLKIIDYSLYPKELFEGATNYPLIFSVKKPTQGHRVNLQGHRVNITVYNTAGKAKSFQLPQDELPLNKYNPKSPWLLAPPHAISAFRKIQRQFPRLGDVYEINMGVKTSANDLYIIKQILQCSGGLAQVELENGDKAVVEAHLIHPMVRGESIRAFSYSVDFHIIFPHDTQSFVPLVDQRQWKLLNAIGVLGRGWSVDAEGKVLIYRASCGNSGCDSVCKNIVIALKNGLKQVTPCPTRWCFEDQSSGLKIRIDNQSGKCIVYVEGLRIPNANNATNHFLNNLERLIKRDDYKINMPPWTIFRVSNNKFSDYRIAWREMAKHLEAAYLPVQVQSSNSCLPQSRVLVPIQTVYFIVEKDICKALLLLAYMNSDLARSLMKLIAWPARGGYFRHTSYTVGHLPVPQALKYDCEAASNLNEAGKQLVEKLNAELPQLLKDISEEEYNELIEYAKWLNETAQGEEMPPEEEEEE